MTNDDDNDFMIDPDDDDPSDFLAFLDEGDNRARWRRRRGRRRIFVHQHAEESSSRFA
jgi:hypothetical protein